MQENDQHFKEPKFLPEFAPSKSAATQHTK
jgi:hypothetical protein